MKLKGEIHIEVDPQDAMDQIVRAYGSNTRKVLNMVFISFMNFPSGYPTARENAKALAIHINTTYNDDRALKWFESKPDSTAS